MFVCTHPCESWFETMVFLHRELNFLCFYLIFLLRSKSWSFLLDLWDSEGKRKGDSQQGLDMGEEKDFLPWRCLVSFSSLLPVFLIKISSPWLLCHGSSTGSGSWHWIWFLSWGRSWRPARERGWARGALVVWWVSRDSGGWWGDSVNLLFPLFARGNRWEQLAQRIFPSRD